MDRNELLRLKGFYENELTNRILAFWLPRCEDREYGGYVNCFDNAGEKLQSYDKYTWSQGRFVWVFSRLAVTRIGIFTQKQRKEFLPAGKERAGLSDAALSDGAGGLALRLSDGAGRKPQARGGLGAVGHEYLRGLLCGAGHGRVRGRGGDREAMRLGNGSMNPFWSG